LRAIWRFQHEHKRLPGESDVAKILAAAKDINGLAKSSEGTSVEEIDEKVIFNASAYSRACISPMASLFGGIVAQEIIKYTGKYSPL
jgi:ubiquitin-activating enzyme E1